MDTENTATQKPLNPITFLLLGLCLIFMAVGGYYYNKHRQLSKLETATTAAQQTTTQPAAPGLPAATPEMEHLQEIVAKETASGLGTVSGKLCYPAGYLPEGLVVLKNLETNELKTFPNPANHDSFEVQVPVGSYNLRYQAYQNGLQGEYMSGYYTKCGINSEYEVCNAPDGHDLIEVEVANGGTTANVNLCDFYYETEPAF